ncbi:hypothetical protein H0H93_014019 [Arthromyces matolae]|nr:hypothetical protein H0H93_014019 [Arthromyces matolae]
MSYESENLAEFFLQAEAIIQDARFIVEALPNVELDSTERILLHLHRIYLVLGNITTPFLRNEELDQLLRLVTSMIIPLENYVSTPRSTFNRASAPPTSTPAGGYGRPRYNIDLERAVELHSLGISWGDVASSMGVDRVTLYRHIRAAGLSEVVSGQYTNIDDEDLDVHVSSISQQHPLAGCRIVQGHLMSRGIQVSVQRAMESLRRVDAIGVALRLVFSTLSPQHFSNFVVDGVGSSKEEYTKLEEVMLFGIKMAMKSSSLGDFMFMVVLMDTLASSSTCSAPTTKGHPPFKVALNMPFLSLAGPVVFEVTLVQKTMALKN